MNSWQNQPWGSWNNKNNRFHPIMFLFWNVVAALFSSSPAVKKTFVFYPTETHYAVLFTHPSYKIEAFIKWTHMYIFDWCAQSMFTCSRKWAFCPTWPQTEWWIIFFALMEGHCKPFWCVPSIGDSLYDYKAVSIWRKMFRVLCDMVFSRFFLMYPAAVFNPLPSCIQTYLQGFMMTHFGNQRRMYYSYRLYQLGNLHEKWRWQFTGSQKCVIRFRTEIGQADDFNSLHDREREESTKSLSLPVTVCYVNSCNISDLCSFNLIISACLCFGA